MESKRAKSRPAPQTCGFRLPTLLRGHPLKTPERSACKKIFYPEQKKTSDFHRKKKTQPAEKIQFRLRTVCQFNKQAVLFIIRLPLQI